MSLDGRDVVVSVVVLVAAAVCEIGGAWLVWRWRKEGWQWAFGLLGSILLIVYGIIPTLQRHLFARMYAAYGGLFIIFALLWGWIAEHTRPDVWDIVGAAIAMIGVGLIMFAPRRW